MMQQQERYGSVAKFFHWIIAALIFTNYILGSSLGSTNLYEVHKQIGLTIFAILILRILWRVVSKYPPMLNELSTLEKAMTRVGHLLLYALMLFVPMAGICVVQAYGYPLNFWGISKLPTLIGTQPSTIAHSINIMHGVGASALVLFAVLHAVIAFKHHFVNHNKVLIRMLPFSKK